MPTNTVSKVTKAYTSYIMFNCFYKYINFNLEKFNNTCIYLKNNKNYYLLLHYRLASNFFPNQLADMFSYEIFITKNRQAVDPVPRSSDDTLAQNYDNSVTCVLVYNIHNLLHSDRIFLFTSSGRALSSGVFSDTISELYINANWLEREVAEMYGLQFAFKKDLRNLMLQYGDSSAPFKKVFPTIGFRETGYSILVDAVVQNRFNLQN